MGDTVHQSRRGTGYRCRIVLPFDPCPAIKVPLPPARRPAESSRCWAPLPFPPRPRYQRHPRTSTDLEICTMAAAQPPPPAAAAALPPLVALEVSNIPPQATHSELASIFSQFCALEEVLTVFKHGSSGGGSDSDGGGCALVLLPAAADAQESAAMAAEILNDYPLQGSLLGVQLCDSPAEWLRRSVNPQVRVGWFERGHRVSFLLRAAACHCHLSLNPSCTPCFVSPQLISCLEQLLAPPPAAPPAAPAVQPPTPRRQQQQNGTEPADGLLWSAASGEASGGYPPSDAGDSSGGGLTPRSAAGGGGGGAAGPGSFAGWETSATCVVVMNIDPRLSAREIGEYFLQ